MGPFFQIFAGIWVGTTLTLEMAHPYSFFCRDPPPRGVLIGLFEINESDWLMWSSIYSDVVIYANEFPVELEQDR